MKYNKDNHIVLSSLIADALSLGSHWIYSQTEIAETFASVREYHDPATAYHPGKRAGDFTHYGDQAMALLRSLLEDGGFDLETFAKAWITFWEDPKNRTYRDGATRGVLANLRADVPLESAASPSNDIAGASRIGVLFAREWTSEDALALAARAQTAFTHGDPAVVEAAEYFARVAFRVREGERIPAALRAVAEERAWEAIPQSWFDVAERSARSDVKDREAAKEHGLTCHIPDAFPVILHFLLRYPVDGVAALEANLRAGGDSAARGMILGMVYGAQSDAITAFPGWAAGLRARDKIESILNRTSAHV